MRRALAGLVTALAVLGCVGIPGSASAANEPTFTVPSASYSRQPRPFTVQVKNNLLSGKVIASLVNGKLDAEMSCSGSGLGIWTCTLPANQILSPGTVRVHAQSVDDAFPNRDTDVVTRSGTISSRLSASGKSTTEGEPFAVTGRYDHLNGVNDYRVSAKVTDGGKVVQGQSAVPCTANPGAGTYRCALTSALGAKSPASRYSVTVTEVSARTGDRRSVSTTVRVTAIKAPAAPRILGPSTVKSKDQPITVTGEADKPGMKVEVTVDSTDFTSPAAVCTSDSAGKWSCALTREYDDGEHTIRARVIDSTLPDKPSGPAIRSFVVGADATATPTPTPTASGTPTAAPSTAAPTAAASAPESSPELSAGSAAGGSARGSGVPGTLDSLIALLILGLAIITMIRPDTVSLAPDGNSPALTDDEPLSSRDGVGPGDQIPTWAFAGQEFLDGMSRTVPATVAPRSPFLARLLVDGSDVRAVFGGLWWFLIGGALLLGLVLGGQAPTLPIVLVVTVLVLGVADATAGTVAAAGVGAVLLLTGSVGTENAVMTTLSLAALWVAPALVGNAVRPFRRPGRASLPYAWDRAADVVVAGVLAGWLALLLARSMDALVGDRTGLPEHATAIGLVTFAAVAARIGLAHSADLWFPERRRLTDSAIELPPPTQLSALVGTVIRTSVFAFVGHVFLGNCWQWIVGVLLFAVPEVLAAVRDSSRFDNLVVRLELPRGLTAVLLVVVTSTLLVVAALTGIGSDLTGLRMAFVVAALVPALFSCVKAVNDEPDPTSSSWPLQIAGVFVVLGSVFLALHGVNF